MTHAITVIAVDDVQESARFYQTVLELPRTVDTPVYVELALAGHALGLYQRDGFARNVGAAAPPRPSGIGAAELYVRVANLDAAIERARGAGARELSPRALRAWGEEAAYFSDPDGFVLALAQAV